MVPSNGKSDVFIPQMVGYLGSFGHSLGQAARLFGNGDGCAEFKRNQWTPLVAIWRR